MAKLPEFTGNYSSESPEARDILEALMIPRRLDVGVLKTLTQAVFPKYRDQRLETFLDLRQQLFEKEYLIWEARIRGDTLSKTTREQIRQSGIDLNPEQIFRGHHGIRKYEQECFERLPDNLPIYAVEQIYHRVQLGLISGTRTESFRREVENDTEKIVNRLLIGVTAGINPLAEFAKRLGDPEEDILKPLHIRSAGDLNPRLSLREN